MNSCDAGVEGVGEMGYSPAGRQFAAEVRALLGANPLELYQTEDGRLIGRAPRFRGAAFQAHMIELRPPGLLPPHAVPATPSHAGQSSHCSRRSPRAQSAIHRR